MLEERRNPDRHLPKSASTGLRSTASSTSSRLPPDLTHPAWTRGKRSARGRPPRESRRTAQPHPVPAPHRVGAREHRGARPTRQLPAALALAVVILALPAVPANAACGNSERISHRDSECLEAWWENKGAFRKSKFHVRNMCPDYGRVVAKVDLKNVMDRTLHLDDGNWRNGSTGHRIRWISCCSDLGDLCNRSDVVTDAGCRAKFLEASPTASSCSAQRLTATAHTSDGSYSCTITTSCKFRMSMGWIMPSTNGLWIMPRWKTSITVPWTELGNVHSCRGVLRPGPCGAGRSVALGLRHTGPWRDAMRPPTSR